MVEVLKLLLNFMSESPILTFFLAPFVFAFVVFIIIAIGATIADVATAFANIFKTEDTKEKKK